MRISDWSSDVCSSDLLFLDLLLGRREDRRIADLGTDIIANAHNDHGQPEADPPTPGKEATCRQSAGQHQQSDRGQQVSHRHPAMGKAAAEPAAALRTMLSNSYDVLSPFATTRQSIYEA